MTHSALCLVRIPACHKVLSLFCETLNPKRLLSFQNNKEHEHHQDKSNPKEENQTLAQDGLDDQDDHQHADQDHNDIAEPARRGGGCQEHHHHCHKSASPNRRYSPHFSSLLSSSSSSLELVSTSSYSAIEKIKLDKQ